MTLVTRFTRLPRSGRSGFCLCLALLLAGCGGGGGSGSSSGGDNSGGGNTGGASVAVRGVDISMLETVEAAGGTFQVNGSSQDLLFLPKAQGVNLVRLRLWVDPKSSSNDSAAVGFGSGGGQIRLAKR